MAKKLTDLVIVESPAKAKTIGKYLGSRYTVTASMGHLRDLPKSTMGVDIESGFMPEYMPIKGREDTIKDLKTEAAKAGKIYLATDPDREGEAISWHLKELLELPDDKVLRVTFNEITNKVVNESIMAPRAIDMNLVDAQQARRILDRIVGYRLSPLLWAKIKRGLSAGRVQSVATRMVVDRENEIRAFLPEEYWLLDVLLECRKSRFTARFYGKKGKKHELNSEDEVNTVVQAITKGSAESEIAANEATFTIKSFKRSDKPKNPPPPFITSTLQQEASRRLNMTPRRTMSIAQQLYEGVDITGEGTVGLITYMRTDSLRISQEAQSEAERYITGTYGKAYYPPAPRVYKAKKGAQDAHEAVRPSSVALSPDKVKGDLTNDQFRLYRLIWSRFLASQMSSAVYDTVTIDAESAGYIFRANQSAVKFNGYLAVYDDESKEDEEKQKLLPTLKEGEAASLKDIKKEQKFTQPPPRYSEDTLIRAMEEKGIGRPSTYAPTLSTILSREYVVKEGKSLIPTSLGETITTLMKERFEDIVDLAFTARMEEDLDDVEEGKREWKSVLYEFYDGFDHSLQEAEKALEGVRIKVPDEETDEVCEKCGKKMVIKSGRFGRFLACPGYPECNNTKPLVVEMPGKCPKCGGRILKRSSKKGYTYYACEKGAECGFMTWDVPVKDNCPECSMTLFKKSGRGFRKPFCINEKCTLFLPEDKRGYKKKSEGESGEAKKNAETETETVELTEVKKDMKTVRTEKTAKTGSAVKAENTVRAPKAEKKTPKKRATGG